MVQRVAFAPNYDRKVKSHISALQHETEPMSTNGTLNRKLRLGLIGGGKGALIGRVHATGAIMDNRAELVAGALSADPVKAKQSALDYDIPKNRAYGSYQELIEKEAALPADQRIDLVAVTTPNHTHFEIAKSAIEAGFDVVCDKPMTFNLTEANELATLVENSHAIFGLTHTYTGYPMVRQIRYMVLGGDIGEINAIRTCYAQGWLRNRIELDDQKQAAWRMDPSKSGAAGCFADIGVHAFNLARYTTGVMPESLSCQLRIYESGRQLDDYGTAIIKMENNVLCTLSASQISHGRENDISIEIDGTKGSILWGQGDPNRMELRCNGQPLKVYTRDPNAPHLTPQAVASCRVPSGCPEGLLEAFGNIYADVYDAIIQRAEEKQIDRTNTIYPNVHDGVEGMMFIEQCVASSKEDGKWLPVRYEKARQ